MLNNTAASPQTQRNWSCYWSACKRYNTDMTSCPVIHLWTCDEVIDRRRGFLSEWSGLFQSLKLCQHMKMRVSELINEPSQTAFDVGLMLSHHGGVLYKEPTHHQNAAFVTKEATITDVNAAVSETCNTSSTLSISTSFVCLCVYTCVHWCACIRLCPLACSALWSTQITFSII